MRIQNETPAGGSSEPFADLLRLQTDFQARLADETFRYLRRLHGTLAPGAPGTVVSPREGLLLDGAGPPGARVELGIDIENVQRVHCVVSPQLTPLVGRAGTTWFPACEPPQQTVLVAPAKSERIRLIIPVPPALPPDEYRGALLLQGFRDAAIAVRILVQAGVDTPRPKTKTARRGRASRRPK
ncbi:MAG: hypothetical protein ACT4P7_17315 [Gemmatimonadaceae bacterium]